jgi:hypothetical protein
VQCWGWVVLAHPPYSPFLPHMITGCFHMWKNIFRVSSLNVEDDTNTAVTASVCCVSLEEYRAAVDCLPHAWEKWVDSAGDDID